MTLKELKEITEQLPSPLNAMVFGKNGAYSATVSFCEDGILIRTDRKSHPLAYHILKLDNFDVDRISGGISFDVDGNQYEIIILRPLLGKYGVATVG